MAESTSSFKNFLKNIEQTIVKLTTLEIRTVIGDYTIGSDNTVQPIAGGELKVFESKINLLDGDIQSSISTQLIAPEYDWVREFHARKEEKGYEIINNNIKAIMSLMELYKSAKTTASKDTTMNMPVEQATLPAADTTTATEEYPPAV
jgi:hypothetical protein